MKEPTEKQISYAEAISNTLHIDLPNPMTRQSLFIFIRDNIEAYKKEQNKIKTMQYYQNYNYYHCSHNRSYGCFNDNPYAGAYGNDEVDCFDYGISPWGDS